jgi:radical SAM superfamily enzyme YgiQ (UPF0313 family)
MKQKIALVKVYFDMFDCVHAKEKQNKQIRPQIQSYPPLGLCSLASFLNSKGFRQVEIIDCVERGFSSMDCAEYIAHNDFSVVGISVTSFQLKETKILIDEIRKRKEGVLIVLGGVHITYDPEIIKVLGADLGIRGEGEESFYRLLTDFSRDIDGLVYTDNGQVKYNHPARVEDLDVLPAPVILNHRYKFPICGNRIYIMANSRGCPYSCIFCGLPNKNYYRTKSAKKIYEELNILAENGYDFVDFKDDCFTLDRGKVVDLCNMLIKKRCGISWGAQTRADLVDFELLKLMKRSGCCFLQFGVESGVSRIRNSVLCKDLSDEALFRAVEICRKLKIKSAGLMLFGSPTESLDDMLYSINFIKRLNPDYMDVLLAVPIIGSGLFEVALKEKKVTIDIWRRIVEEGQPIPVYVPEGVSLESMEELQSRAYRNFYFQPGKIVNECRSIVNPRLFLSKLNIAYNILKNY